MTKVDDPMPAVAREKVFQQLKTNRETNTTQERLSGVEWLRARLSRGRYVHCGDHYHAECMNCGNSTKCLGESGYDRYEEIQQVCDCEGEATAHLVVPFDNFGQHVGFP